MILIFHFVLKHSHPKTIHNSCRNSDSLPIDECNRSINQHTHIKSKSKKTVKETLINFDLPQHIFIPTERHFSSTAKNQLIKNIFLPEIWICKQLEHFLASLIKMLLKQPTTQNKIYMRKSVTKLVI